VQAIVLDEENFPALASPLRPVKGSPGRMDKAEPVEAERAASPASPLTDPSRPSAFPDFAPPTPEAERSSETLGSNPNIPGKGLSSAEGSEADHTSYTGEEAAAAETVHTAAAVHVSAEPAASADQVIAAIGSHTETCGLSKQSGANTLGNAETGT